jgi:membrane protease YdiL (CAAX protease family)
LHITFVLLGAAIASVWLPSYRWKHGRFTVAPWAVLHAAAVLVGLLNEALTWPAAAALLALAGCCLCARYHAGLRCIWTWAAGGLSLALALHALPGFHNPIVLDAVRTSPKAPPFSLYANFDKASAGLLLLACFAPRLRSWRDCRAIAAPTLQAFALAALATLGLAWVAGQVQPDAKWPPFAPVFLAVNLLFTCVAEEAFFRGLIQEQLTRALTSLPGLASWVPIAVSTVLFGLAHAGSGLAYIGLASLAGLAYAAVYARTRRTEAAVLTHFLLNATHFLLFTYPARTM